MIRNLCCCLLLALGSVGLAAQQADPREGKLLVLEHLWNEAQVNRDSSALEALVSSRFVKYRVGWRTYQQTEISC